MSTPELRDAFENELRRVLIQNHPNFGEWYATLSPRARQVIDSILDVDVTPELIYFSQETVEKGSEMFQFLQVIAGGNPSPNVALALTNFALGDILLEVRDFGKSEK